MRSAPCLPVLMYHHVSPHTGSLTTSPSNFESQLAWLRRAGYRTLGSDDLAGFFAGEPVPAKSVVLTFDDGYLDNYIYAHPILARHGMRALLFAVTGWVGEGPARPCLGQVPDNQLPPTWGHREAKAKLDDGEHDRVIMRWSELERLRTAGTFEVHSHTHSHRRWDLELADPDRRLTALTKDLQQSRHTLKDRLGEVSAHLCWPQGYYDDDYLTAAAAAGFHYCYTTNARGLNRAHQSPAEIYRMSVKNRGGWVFGQRVWLGRSPFWGELYLRWKR